jgi:hypothetical protein
MGANARPSSNALERSLSVKRIFSFVAALVLVLALAGPTFATSSTGSTTELVNVPGTVSLVVPTSITYTFVTPTYNSSVAIMGLATNSSTGATVTMTTSTLVAGTSVIPTTKRSAALPVVTGVGWVRGTPMGIGAFLDSTTVMTIATCPNQNCATGTATFATSVDPTGAAGGSYVGTLSFTAATN